MHAKKDCKRRALPLLVSAPLLVALVLLLLPLIPLLLATYLLYATLLHVVLWICWCSRGVNVLLIYSDSPHWHDYMETHILPRLPSSSVVLNWSDRRSWKSCSLSVMAFRFFGGSREFNPLVVVLRPFRWAKTYRFWKPFKDYKHGKTATLETLRSDLFQELSRTGIGPRGF